MTKPVVLIILDGWGYTAERRGNAIAAARTPTLERIERFFPFTLLQASGISVGLPWNEPGNSEVGHMNMGTGSIRYQALTRISRSILDGSFFKNETLLGAAEHVRAAKSALHLMGLWSSGSVHAYRDHVHALLEFARHERIAPVFLHLFLDGRDGPPQEGAERIKELMDRVAKTHEGVLASVIGRRYAMNRDGHWGLTQKCYDLLTRGKGVRTADPIKAILDHYQDGLTDEYIEPIVLETGGRAGRAGHIEDGDAVIFFNFREDSARQLAYAFARPERVITFTPKRFKNLFFATMTHYAADLPSHFILPPIEVRGTVSELISAGGSRQFKIAETEKYAHVTYFFNGGREEPFSSEDRLLVPSLKVRSHADSPEMRAREIAQELLGALEKGKYRFLLANFANADTLAHTGDFDATRRGVEVVDEILGDIVERILVQDGAAIVTSDHGHAEVMLDLKTGKVLTRHSSSSVPFYLVANEFKRERSDREISRRKESIEGILADVGATTLELLGIEPTASMEGKSLLGRLRQL